MKQGLDCVRTKRDWSKTTSVFMAGATSTRWEAVFLDAVHHRNGVGIAALFQYWKIYRALAIHVNHVVLQRMRVLQLAHIRHPAPDSGRSF